MTHSAAHEAMADTVALLTQTRDPQFDLADELTHRNRHLDPYGTHQPLAARYMAAVSVAGTLLAELERCGGDPHTLLQTVGLRAASDPA